jgi:hypothetical protein
MLSKFTYFNFRQVFRSGGFLFLITTLCGLSSFAQTAAKDDEMPRDERGKYIYYQIVEGKQIPSDSLYSRVTAFLEMKKLSAVQSRKGRTSASGKFLISKTAFVLTHPSGEVLYDFVFEAKNGKYRFWLTDFVFIPYQRDRYANFSPSAAKGTPLETGQDKHDAGEWTSYLTAAGKLAGAFGADLKDFLSAERKSKPNTKAKISISTKNW